MELFSGNKNKVIVSRDDVAEFNRAWPCSKLDSNRHYWFEFDTNGDLVDTDVPEHSDGPEVIALCADAYVFLTESN